MDTTLNPKHFSRKNLPFNDEMKFFWKQNGFIIIDNFYTENECDKLRERTVKIVRNFDYSNHKTIINSKEKEHANDSYCLGTSDKIRSFFEEGAFDNKGNLTNSIEYVINKIGHAMHDLDPVYHEFVHRKDLDDIAKKINIKNPKLLQSMYIFKQPKIGGKVVCHQDSTFLYTKPESTVGFWVALEDANKENGPLCPPLDVNIQPFSLFASSSATQKPTVDSGFVYKKVES
jgi:phytanoyl-CoA hydroxylase